jgi:hypothetical protein
MKMKADEECRIMKKALKDIGTLLEYPFPVVISLLASYPMGTRDSFPGGKAAGA